MVIPIDPMRVGTIKAAVERSLAGKVLARVVARQ
jgi:hypothetical protein